VPHADHWRQEHGDEHRPNPTDCTLPRDDLAKMEQNPGRDGALVMAKKEELLS
jgi:hypothetical protein